MCLGQGHVVRSGIGRATPGYRSMSVARPTFVPISAVVQKDSSGAPWWAGDRTAIPVRVLPNWRFRLSLAALAILLIAALSVSAFVSPPERSRQISVGIIEDPPSLDALVATCSGVIRWEDPANLLTRLPWEDDGVPVATQVSQALANAPRVRPGFYTDESPDLPTTAEIAGYLYQGGRVIWFAPGLEPNVTSGVEGILTILSEEGVDYIALPWPAEASNKMPVLARTVAGRRLLAMKWGVAQSCAVASGDVLIAFAEDSPRPGK